MTRLTRKREAAPRTAEMPRSPFPDTKEFEGYTIRSETGVSVWRNPENGFLVAAIHFTADPEKRNPEFAARKRARNPEKFDADMNIDFSSKAGEKVLKELEFKEARPEDMDCDCLDCRDVRKIGGYGIHSTVTNVVPACVFPSWFTTFTSTDPSGRNLWVTSFLRVDSLGIVHLYACIMQRNYFYKQAKIDIAARLHGAAATHIIDPAASQRQPQSEKTLLELMLEDPYSMECYPATHKADQWLEVQELKRLMFKREDGLFGLYIHISPELRPFVQMLRNTVWDGEGQKVLDREKDPFDTLKYFATWRVGKSTRPLRPIESLPSRQQQAMRVAIVKRDARKRAMQMQKERDRELIHGGGEEW